MNVSKILIGADPEVFVKHRKTGKHISAYGMVKGDKKNPLAVDKGAVQVDGMALEFNINPAENCDEFVDNIFSVMGTLQSMIEHEIDIVPTAEFGKKYIDEQPEEAKILGCDPDYNAYTGLANEKPNGDLGFRTAAGHLHIGWCTDADVQDDNHIIDCIYVVKLLDNVLYSLSTLWDDDKKRRNMYGQRGSFRPKPYGVEYRVLSNAWLKHPEITKFVYQLTSLVMKQALEGTIRSGDLVNVMRGDNLKWRDNTRLFFSTLLGWCGLDGSIPYWGEITELYHTYLKVKEVVSNEK